MLLGEALRLSCSTAVAVAQQRLWLCNRCAWGHRLVQHQLLPAGLSGCTGSRTLLSLLQLRPHFPGLRCRAGLQSPERWVLRDMAFHLPRLAALSPRLGTHHHASARVWLD